MRPMTTPQTLAWSLILALGWVGVEAWTTDDRSAVELASTGVFFFVVAFLSMRLSSRVTAWAQSRFAKPEAPPPEPIASSTDRPEHAQRRRDKRRKRTYRRKR